MHIHITISAGHAWTLQHLKEPLHNFFEAKERQNLGLKSDEGKSKKIPQPRATHAPHIVKIFEAPGDRCGEFEKR